MGMEATILEGEANTEGGYPEVPLAPRRPHGADHSRFHNSGPPEHSTGRTGGSRRNGPGIL